MFKNAKKIALICGTLILCVAPLYATNVEPSNTRGEKPGVVKPETKPTPMPVKPETKPAPMPVKPETKPAPMPVKPETKPTPIPVKPECKPCPEPVKPPTPNCKQTPYYTSYEKILATMKENMSNLKPTGDATTDFLAEMIPHHQGGISMSENILKYTKNDEVKSLANSIIKEQKCDISKMEKLLAKLKNKNCNCKDKEAEYLQKYEVILNTMMTAMTDAKATCNDDVDFLTGMINHHKGAISMSNNILNYTNNSAVKKMAKKMIKSQEAEVKQMQELVSKLQK